MPAERGAPNKAAAHGFVPPAYPYDRLDALAQRAGAIDGGLVDLSIGTPCDPPPPAVIEALAAAGGVRGYPSSVGTAPLLDAARAWIERRFGVALDRSQLAACVGTKELVAGLPHWLRLRRPDRDTVLYPSVSYPTYAMGAELARCRAVPVPPRAGGGIDLSAIDEEDAARALCLWVNSPANPAGDLTDLAAAAAFGRERGVPVLSDECYAEFTWNGRPRTILEHGSDGVLAVHSISKRSNCAGLRVGFYAGDPELVHYLSELRRHAGFMVPGPAQAAAAAALGDDDHVEAQRARYHERMEILIDALAEAAVPAHMPDGSFYLWVVAPPEARRPIAPPRPEARPLAAPPAEDPASVEGSGAGWRFTAFLAEEAGTLVSPGEFYGPDGSDFVRIALVQPTDRIELAAKRLREAVEAGASPSGMLGQPAAG